MIFLTQCASTKQKWSRFSGLCLFCLIPPEASSNGLSQNLMVAPGPQQTVQISAGMKHLPEWNTGNSPQTKINNLVSFQNQLWSRRIFVYTIYGNGLFVSSCLRILCYLRLRHICSSVRCSSFCIPLRKMKLMLWLKTPHQDTLGITKTTTTNQKTCLCSIDNRNKKNIITAFRLAHLNRRILQHLIHLQEIASSFTTTCDACIITKRIIVKNVRDVFS